jgi:chorismate dehydratase
VRESLASLRVGRLPYLNALPFHAAGSGVEPCFVVAPPRRLGELAAADVLDAALLASRDALALAPRFRPLEHRGRALGIACHGAVASVLLLSRVPAAGLSGARIALSGESRTSRALLRVLLAERFALRGVEYVEAGEPADARLVIGDAALAARPAAHGLRVLDLGAAWTAWTGLPFAYACWVVRHDVPRELAAVLAASLADSIAKRDALAAEPFLPLPPGVDRSLALRYLARFAYLFGPAERAGLARFHQELLEHDLLTPPCEGRRLGPAPRDPRSALVPA